MSESERLIDTEPIQAAIRDGSTRRKEHLAATIAAGISADDSVDNLPLAEDGIRRWAREFLVPQLTSYHAELLADRLLQFQEDFRAERRDRTTAPVILAASEQTIQHFLLDLAAGNATDALWNRFAEISEERVLQAAEQVLTEGSVEARVTTMHILALDPYGPQYLSRSSQNALLVRALKDGDSEVRGLAAEVISVDIPEALLAQAENAWTDPGERVRMAYWRTLFAVDPSIATELAGMAVLDAGQPLDVRRSALLALGEHLQTRDVAPILQAVLRGGDETLAADAADLMWRFHRAPDVAYAASESAFPHVRELAERLLHPERGSPAAGGSRPGDPTRTAEIFEQISSSESRKSTEPDEQ